MSDRDTARAALRYALSRIVLDDLDGVPITRDLCERADVLIVGVVDRMLPELKDMH